jgi:hypothetical protein
LDDKVDGLPNYRHYKVGALSRPHVCSATRHLLSGVGFPFDLTLCHLYCDWPYRVAPADLPACTDGSERAHMSAYVRRCGRTRLVCHRY